MKESEFSRKLINYFNSLPDTFFFKEHGSQFGSGIPDLIGSYNGEPFGLELKVYDIPKRDSTIMDITKDVTPSQRHKMKAMAVGGWTCFIGVLLRPTNIIIWVDYQASPKLTKSEFETLSMHTSPEPDFPTSIKHLNSLMKGL